MNKFTVEDIKKSAEYRRHYQKMEVQKNSKKQNEVEDETSSFHSLLINQIRRDLATEIISEIEKEKIGKLNLYMSGLKKAEDIVKKVGGIDG